MPKYNIDKEKCIGCGLCVAECPGGTELGEDGKAYVVDHEKLDKCDGEKICLYGAILRQTQDGGPVEP